MRRSAAGVLARLSRRIRRHLPGRAGVLAYHRIGHPGCDPWHLAVSPIHFDEQLGVLQRLGRITPLAELIGLSVVRRLPHVRPQFAVTFDDGYVDNLTDAVPTLERHGAAATVFIALGLLDQPSYWWDVLAEWAFGSGCASRELVDAAAAVGLLPAERTAALADADVATIHAEMYEVLVRLPPDDVRPLLDRLAVASGVDTPQPPTRPMTTRELLELASHPLISIGVHTVSHPRLTLLADDEVRREISGAGRLLSNLLGAEQRVLAYPYGDTSATVGQIAAAAGFEHAVTTDARWLSVREDPMFVPRLAPRDVSGGEFEEWLRRWT